MLKAILMSVWLMGLLAGSVYYFGAIYKSGSPEGAEADNKPKLEYVKLEPITSVVIRDNAIKGYIIVELSAAIEKTKVAAVRTPVEMLMRDRVVGALHKDTSLDPKQLDKFDLDQFTETVRRSVNQRFGEEFVAELLVQNINFIPSNAVRQGSPEG